MPEIREGKSVVKFVCGYLLVFKEIEELFKRVKVYSDTEEVLINYPNCSMTFTCVRELKENK